MSQLELDFTVRLRSIPRRTLLTWVVIAVDEHGHSPGNCGHRHATDLDAVRCPWTPDPWPEVCDLLVREIRDRGADQVRTKPVRRAA